VNVSQLKLRSEKFNNNNNNNNNKVLIEKYKIFNMGVYITCTIGCMANKE
jgi:hypothetical protein